MKRDFQCYVGECIGCCTGNLILPITISDIYRAWVYQNSKEKNGTSFYGTYQSFAKGWRISPSLGDSRIVVVAPLSRMPCKNVDTEKKECKAHGKYQYTGCGLCPEEHLIPAPKGYHDSPETTEFFKSLDCLKDVVLTPERVGKLEEMRKLFDNELYLTVMIINHPNQPVLTSRYQPLSNNIVSEFERRLRYLGTPDGMRQL